MLSELLASSTFPAVSWTWSRLDCWKRGSGRATKCDARVGSIQRKVGLRFYWTSWLRLGNSFGAGRLKRMTTFIGLRISGQSHTWRFDRRQPKEGITVGETMDRVYSPTT